MTLPAGVGAGTQFKYVILAGKNPPRWENRANRNWREVEAPVVTHIWDSTQRLGRIPWAQVARDLAGSYPPQSWNKGDSE